LAFKLKAFLRKKSIKHKEIEMGIGIVASRQPNFWNLAQMVAISGWQRSGALRY
jgi:hypothetical protein